jgi:hypothetical protein
MPTTLTYLANTNTIDGCAGLAAKREPVNPLRFVNVAKQLLRRKHGFARVVYRPQNTR